MSARSDTFRPSTRSGLLGAMALATGFALVGAFFIRPGDTGAVVGVAAFFLYRVGVVRLLICRQHATGMRRSRAGRYAEALVAFTASEAVWRRRAWVDRNRSWVLGSTVRWPFAALATYNRAYCLARLDRAGEAADVLDTLLEEHPGMRPARDLRDGLRAGASLAPSTTPLDKADWGDLTEIDEAPSPGPPGSHDPG